MTTDYDAVAMVKTFAFIKAFSFWYETRLCLIDRFMCVGMELMLALFEKEWGTVLVFDFKDLLIQLLPIVSCTSKKFVRMVVRVFFYGCF